MTITPRRIFTGELGTMEAEWDTYTTGTGAIDVVSNEKMSGTYSFRLATSSAKTARAFIPATKQVRFGGHFMANAYSIYDEAHLMTLLDGSTEYLLNISLHADTNELLVVVDDGPNEHTGAYVNPLSWTHISCDCKLHPTSGWIHVYVDGIPVYEYSGATPDRNIRVFQLADDRIGRDFESGSYADDIYIDDTTGEVLPAPPPDKRFLLAGSYADAAPTSWTRSDPLSTASEHLMDIPPDSDTYLEAAEAGLDSAFLAQEPTIPDGYVPGGVWVVATAYKSNAEVDSRLRIEKLDSLQGLEPGDGQPLATSGSPVRRRFSNTSFEQKIYLISAGDF